MVKVGLNEEWLTRWGILCFIFVDLCHIDRYIRHNDRQKMGGTWFENEDSDKIINIIYKDDIQHQQR